MTWLKELGGEIHQDAGFREDLSALDISNLAKSLKITGYTQVSDASVARLVQAATIFALSDDAQLRELAQRISTAVLGVRHDESVGDLVALVQARLKNYPAIAGLTGQSHLSSHVPFSVHLEFQRGLRNQTIVAGGIERQLSEFQLSTWSALKSGSDVAVSAPTSAGKSFVLELFVCEKFLHGRAACVVVVVPTRALITQVSESLEAKLSSAGAFDVLVSTVPVTSDAGGRILYVLTQERLNRLLTDAPRLEFDLCVVDEAQVVADGARGVLLEEVLQELLRRRPTTQVVLSGPLISNPDYFQNLLGLARLESSSTSQGLVTQNVIYVNVLGPSNDQVEIRLRDRTAPSVAVRRLPFAVVTDADRLAIVSSEFGAEGGGAIVYAGGKAEAEKIAIKIADQLEPSGVDLSELITFVRKHVHKDYALAQTLQKGVAFHYGHMPALLRTELERHFKDRKIKFLVCTSTLLFGLNLPARSIFLLKPTTGKDSPISSSQFWNLAGRAGRLGLEREGNIFIVDYDRWQTDPVSGSRSVVVHSAMASTLLEKEQEVVSALAGQALGVNDRTAEVVATKLMIDQQRGVLHLNLPRYERANSGAEASTLRLQAAAAVAVTRIGLPLEVVQRSLSISPFRQQALFEYFVRRIPQIGIQEVLPAHPLADWAVAHPSIVRALRRIHTYLRQLRSTDRSHTFFAPLALRWMRGDPLPLLIDASISYHRKSPRSGKSLSIARIIRDTMENVEDALRFRYVQEFSCYNAVLAYALERLELSDSRALIPDIPLFLEMGGSSGVMINLMAVGLSRTTAEALSDYATKKDMTLDEVRTWIAQGEFAHLDIPPACFRELEQLQTRRRAIAID